MDLSEASLREALRREAFDYSVYAPELKKAANSSAWKGGVPFEAIERESNRFYDVFGGASELAYESDSFYALGSSWLLTRTKPTPVELSAEEIYVDLGFRLAINPPAKSARERILEWIDLRAYLND